MKTKQIMNTGQMVRRGQIGKLPGGGAKGAILANSQGGNKLHSGEHCPCCPIVIVRP